MAKVILYDSFIPKDGYWRRVRGFKDHPKGGWPGVDYGIKTGSMLLAVANGAINKTYTIDDDKGFGRYVLIQLRDSKGKLSPFFVAYAHLSKVSVKPHQVVRQGQLIGYSGYSGYTIPNDSRGAHLHFSLLQRVNGVLVPIDPEHPSNVKWVIKNYKTPPYPPKPVPKPAPKPSPKPAPKPAPKPIPAPVVAPKPLPEEEKPPVLTPVEEKTEPTPMNNPLPNPPEIPVVEETKEDREEVEKPVEQPVKSGYKTTEFYVALVPFIILAVKNLLGIEFTEDFLIETITAVTGLINSALYIYSRVVVKTGVK